MVLLKWFFLVCTIAVIIFSFNLLMKIPSKMMYPPKQIRIRNALIGVVASVLLFSLTYFTW